MESFIDIQKRLLPDLLQVMQKRHLILKSVRIMQPVGRRSLAHSLGMTERVLRSEVEFLKDQDLIEIKSSGMMITAEGELLLKKTADMMREITGIDSMEKELKTLLDLHEIVIVPGNSDESPWVKEELGRSAALRMKDLLDGNNIIAVTGGSTMAAVAEILTPDFSEDEVLVCSGKRRNWRRCQKSSQYHLRQNGGKNGCQASGALCAGSGQYRSI